MPAPASCLLFATCKRPRDQASRRNSGRGGPQCSLATRQAATSTQGKAQDVRVLWNGWSYMAFDSETLKSLLNMAEGPTLDFKREQYRFKKASDTDKSELLKDILAFVNAQRYRTAYILLGVEQIEGRHSEVVGVEDHLDDANIHQFVNSKTNRPAEFTYFLSQVEDKQIGVLSIPLQTRPVYILRKYGKVEDNTVYVRDGSSTRHASPDEIAAMGRGTPPKWSLDYLRTLAKGAVTTAVQEWGYDRYRQIGHGAQYRIPSYKEAREFVIGRSRLLSEYTAGLDSYESLHWIFERFEELASYCSQMFRTVGPSLVEYGALIRAMVNVENYVEREKEVWREFLIRTDDHNAPLPAEAGYNLLVIAELAARLVDVLDSENLADDSEYEARRQFAPEAVYRSKQWGEWRR